MIDRETESRWSAWRARSLRNALPLLLGLFCGAVAAMDQLDLQRGGQTLRLTGQVVVEAQDGGLLLLAQDGTLWIVEPGEIRRKSSDSRPFEALSQEHTAKQLLAGMPRGFRIHTTANYVLCYNTSTPYAEWCGSLYERLFRGFYNYWKNRGWRLERPVFPLVALVFEDRQSYEAHAEAELGTSLGSIIGFYNVRTNRVSSYDLTGVEGLNRGGRPSTTAARVNQILSQPAAERSVATIVHEATHQLAYNSGLQTRYAANPFWLSEGIAAFFETPDLGSTKAWGTIGAVNHVHLAQLRRSASQRRPGFLAALLQDDSRFRDARMGPVVYSEAWALNYYLARTQRRQYVAYVKALSAQKPLSETTPEQRLVQFTEVFGNDLGQLEVDLLKYLQRVR